MINKFLASIIIFMLVFITSGSSILFSWVFKIPLLMLVLSLVFIKGNASSNINFLARIFFVSLIWIGINFLSLIIISTPFDFTAVLMFDLNLILALAVLQLFGWSFWVKFEKIVFYLTLISLPIFLFNVLLPSYFESLLNIFRPLTNERFYRFDEFRNYWSAIVYVKAMKADFLYRNCGFMWEPGSFAMIIIWGLGFNWLTNGIKIDSKTIVYSVALITTQSTAGYIAFFILILALYVKKISIQNVLLIIAFVYLFIGYIYELDFIGGKLDTYLYAASNDVLNYNTKFGAYKVNRIQILQYDLIRVLEYPLGYGFNYQGDIISVNGLSSALLMWGVILFSYFIFLIRKFYSLANYYMISNKSVILLFLGLLIMFFSNPINQSIFFYLLIATPIVIKKNIFYNEQKV